MPEGDTVYLTAATLRRALAGRRLTRLELRVPRLALAEADGAGVEDVVSIGKHLFVRLSDGRSLHSHLRMDGSWRVGAAADRPRGRSFEIRALLANSEHLAVGIRVHDLALVARDREREFVGHLGPDLLAADFDIDGVLQRFHSVPGRAIADALLDQRLVAGLGNVYRSELMFLHRLGPGDTVADVADLRALIGDARRLLLANATTFDRTTTGRRQPGERLFVYGRRGMPCRVCGGRVEMMNDSFRDATDQTRVLYYCSRCQVSAAAPGASPA
jgi:endonuclease-8